MSKIEIRVSIPKHNGCPDYATTLEIIDQEEATVEYLGHATLALIKKAEELNKKPCVRCEITAKGGSIYSDENDD